MNLLIKVFLIDMDFRRTEVIQGFVLNFSLHLLTFSEGARVSRSHIF